MALYPGTFNILSLCSGVAGLDLGLGLAVDNARTVGFVEIDIYACAVLEARMEDQALAAAPLWTDLRTFDGRPWRGVVDCVTAGYPCQPFSVAGARRGADDPRHLWPEVARILQEVEPGYVFLENVSNHLNLGYREVRQELESMGYTVTEALVTAAEVGAPHKRERLFILAYAAFPRRQDGPTQGERSAGLTGAGRYVADTEDRGPQRPAGERSAPRAGVVGRSADVAHPQCPERRSRALSKDCRGPRGDGERQASRPTGKCRPPLAHPLQPELARRPGERGDTAAQQPPAPGAGGDLFPPGPADSDAWSAYLERHPETQPCLRGGPDGLAPGLDERIDRLRCGGNGVVAVQAAYAFILLMQQLQERLT